MEYVHPKRGLVGQPMAAHPQDGTLEAAPCTDAPASNRASERYEENLLSLLWQGVDFLEISYAGDSNKDVLAELQRLKACAQSRDAFEVAKAWKTIESRTFLVRDRGAGRFAFVLHDDDFLIKVRGEGASTLPLAFVQVRSHHLLRVGAGEAAKEAEKLVRALGEVTGEECVSRIDIAADFSTCERFDQIERSQWITRADFRHAYSVGEHFTGWSLGLRGPTAFRLYDKQFEVTTQSKKTYLFDIWTAAGWFPGDSAWRAEYQVRRETLALFGLRSVATTLEALPGLWGYLTKEWLRLVVPNTGDENRARWPLHPFWGQLQLIPWEGTRLRVKRIPKQASIPSDKYIARAALALVSTEMAVAGVTDPDDAWASVKAKLDHHLTKQEQWEGADRDRLLQERALLKERKYGTNLLAKKLGQISGIAPTREPGEEG